MTWDEPTAEKCEKCGGTLFKKLGKGAHLYCAKEGCGFTKPLTRPGQAAKEGSNG